MIWRLCNRAKRGSKKKRTSEEEVTPLTLTRANDTLKEDEEQTETKKETGMPITEADDLLKMLPYLHHLIHPPIPSLPVLSQQLSFSFIQPCYYQQLPQPIHPPSSRFLSPYITLHTRPEISLYHYILSHSLYMVNLFQHFSLISFHYSSNTCTFLLLTNFSFCHFSVCHKYFSKKGFQKPPLFLSLQDSLSTFRRRTLFSLSHTLHFLDILLFKKKKKTY